MFIDINAETYNSRLFASLTKGQEDGKYFIKYRIQNGVVLVEEFNDEASMNAKFEKLLKIGSSDYNDMDNKPSINGVTLEGNKTTSELGIERVVFRFLDELPEEGEENIIYFIPSSEPGSSNLMEEYIWINGDWEKIGLTTVDLSSKQDVFQFGTLPTANASNVGKIFQYVGTNTSDYKNGYFYTCVSDGEQDPTYSWKNIQVQNGGYYLFNYSDSNNDIISVLQEVYNYYLENHVFPTVICVWDASDGISGKLNFVMTSIVDSIAHGPTRTVGMELSSSFFSEFSNNITAVALRSVHIRADIRDNVVTGVYKSVGRVSLVNADKVLTKENTTSYTPTQDYHPATKKYVDDSMGNLLLECDEGEWAELTPAEKEEITIAIVDSFTDLTATDQANLHAITGDDTNVTSDLTEEEAEEFTNEIIGGE